MILVSQKKKKKQKEQEKKKIPTITHSFGHPTVKSQFLTYFIFSPISSNYTSAMLQAPGNIVPGSPKEENPNLLTSGVALSLKGFPGGSVVKNPPANAGNTRFDPWVGKRSWRRKCQLTPVFLLENPKDRGVRWFKVHGVTKSWTPLSACTCARAHTHTHTHTSNMSFSPVVLL